MPLRVSNGVAEEPWCYPCMFTHVMALQEDVSLKGYKKHLESQSAPAPLTSAEEELEEIKKTEVRQHLALASPPGTEGMAWCDSQSPWSADPCRCFRCQEFGAGCMPGSLLACKYSMKYWNVQIMGCATNLKVRRKLYVCMGVALV